MYVVAYATIIMGECIHQTSCVMLGVRLCKRRQHRNLVDKLAERQLIQHTILPYARGIREKSFKPYPRYPDHGGNSYSYSQSEYK
jgi:hypothetical protein